MKKAMIFMITNPLVVFEFCLGLALGLGVSVPARAGPGGTRISVAKSALAEVAIEERYSWTLSESLQVPNQVTLVIPQGQSAAVGFNLVATRLGPEVTTSQGTVRGEVCVTNTGSQMTQGLRIHDQLEREVSPGNWQWVLRSRIPVRYELRSGARRCFVYEFAVTLDPQSQYRNKAIVTINNFEGYEGSARSVTAVAPVEISSSLATVDATAAVSDPFSCPTGFNCELQGTVTQITGSTTVPFSVVLSNLSAECGQTLLASDTGTLIPSDTQVPVTATAGVKIYTGTCTRPSPSPTAP